MASNKCSIIKPHNQDKPVLYYFTGFGRGRLNCELKKREERLKR